MNSNINKLVIENQEINNNLINYKIASNVNRQQSNNNFTEFTTTTTTTTPTPTPTPTTTIRKGGALRTQHLGCVSRTFGVVWTQSS